MERGAKRAEVAVEGITVHGIGLDAQTRCGHYSSERDVVALKFNCCRQYCACYYCHAAVCDHEPTVWKKREFGEKAVLCGGCGTELPIEAYLACESACPHCETRFNPGCADHYHLYFEV